MYLWLQQGFYPVIKYQYHTLLRKSDPTCQPLEQECYQSFCRVIIICSRSTPIVPIHEIPLDFLRVSRPQLRPALSSVSSTRAHPPQLETQFSDLAVHLDLLYLEVGASVLFPFRRIPLRHRLPLKLEETEPS